ncbi:DUF1640 domain-containing protein [Sulfolobus sp. B1]|uniref:DUF1640 domain-containing protein n=1 Tax=Sulfolobaceae TaxID=118883 RepID=UPI00084606B7|nr:MULTISPECIES: DUF1640 domain-containing protein [unclassified Sulfolobus]TRM76742.1 DUF1640 domain-containing protein [Sulfolobus sp. E5]TRM77727.1 DUF1640 domain-containing protein [Sulfolobus sp. B5]TRM78070.1 DUF1640 domain-containing protein [Sulfolobus sp. A20-N-F8]TRM82405.1 DUF1640 domain-containing protein [Sulfolobus sp. D5]TRM88778.1 DUF1640 domain-containing protein [Sulfolobus sp. C3]TRN00549.1 DUF1640 domain-containing protein [Sulfolobus sp. F1]TRN00936.1 DUF1640 domain-cont
MSSTVDEVYNKLKNDKEFIERLANAIADKIVIKKLEELSSEIVRLTSEMNKMREEFSDEMRKLREDQNKLREDINKMREEFTNEIKKLREDMNKYYTQIAKFVENLTTSIEDDAQLYLEWLIEKELGYKVQISRLELENIAEIDLFAEFGNYVLIGEVKSRANRSVFHELMRKIEKLKMSKREMFENKKIIPVIFTLSPTIDLIQLCKESKVFLTSGSRNLTEFKEII